LHSPKPPEAPDPLKTAIGQTGANVGSAIGTQLTNATNQVTPQGNLTYSQDGERSWVDPLSGKTYKVPILTATQTYSPEQQHLYDLDTQTQTNIGNIGVQQSQRMGELLNSPVDLSSTAIDDNLYARYSPRVIAQQQQAADAHKSALAAQGITQGSTAWDHEMDQESQHNNDQWNSLYLGGRQQAIGEMIQQRQEPINELTGLLSQSQVTNPAFGQTPTAAIKPPDYEGDVYNSYNAQMQGYNAKLQSQNAMMGGLFGTIGAIGGGLAGGWARSDRRLKTDIWPIGTLPNGLTLYAYRMKDDPARQLWQGVMADEVAVVDPAAVRMRPDGYYEVNYGEVFH
jgi:hypothetical protein